jgi:hypothetical protein
MILQPYIAAQGVRQALGWTEAGGSPHLADTAIAALDPTVGLGMTGLDEAVGHAVGIAGAIKAMTPGGIAFAGGAEAIGKLLTFIGQDFLHLEGAFATSGCRKLAAFKLVFSPRQAMGTMRGILTVVAAPPLAHRGAIQVVLAGQFAFRLVGFTPLLVNRGRGPRIFM